MDMVDCFDREKGNFANNTILAYKNLSGTPNILVPRALNMGITHVYSFFNICLVPRKLFEHRLIG